MGKTPKVGSWAVPSGPRGRWRCGHLPLALGADTVAVSAESLQEMHASAGEGGFAVEPAQAMVGPVFTRPAK